MFEGTKSELQEYFWNFSPSAAELLSCLQSFCTKLFELFSTQSKKLYKRDVYLAWHPIKSRTL